MPRAAGVRDAILADAARSACAGRAVRRLGHRPAAGPGRAGDRDHRPGPARPAWRPARIWSSAPTAAALLSRGASAPRRPPTSRRPLACFIYRYVRDDATDGYHWYFRDERRRRRDPHQRRAGLRVRRHNSGKDARPAGPNRCRARVLDTPGPGLPGLVDRVNRRPRRLAACRAGEGFPGYIRTPRDLGSWVGLGRRRRLLQGSDHHPRHHRRPARRARSWPARSLPGDPTRSAATRPNATSCRCACSA